MKRRKEKREIQKYLLRKYCLKSRKHLQKSDNVKQYVANSSIVSNAFIENVILSFQLCHFIQTYIHRAYVFFKQKEVTILFAYEHIIGDCQDHRKWTQLFLIFLFSFSFLFDLFSFSILELRVRISDDITQSHDMVTVTVVRSTV